MSNHGGSYMLNELLRKMVTLKLFECISAETKEKLIAEVRRLCGEHDCNWAETIDEELAQVLGVCRYCSKMVSEIGEDGYCVKCQKKLRF